ncbi:uncharacterized protein LOC109834203 [Asparagus officinalis]|uniref:uncharacterized protein LOC109834203 n=1 Tax=Asparagus officinalis TaxID=4686 RepID=UPI00098E2069|nr:uncharacterized protein LOC109834203 [Asparagus officinalis]
MCRNFLWGKTDQIHRKPPLVSWVNVCQGKKRGGLGIFSATIWNIPSALRSIWYIHVNKESLWIKWVHENYLKQGNIWQINARKSDSWMWKQLLKVRDKSLAFCGDSDNLKMLINSCCKTRLNSPLQETRCHGTKQFGRIEMSLSILSFTGACLESRDHLFFECIFSCNVWNHIMEWLKFEWRSSVWQQLQNWFNTRLRGKSAKQKLKRLALNAAIYNIWRERNSRLFQQKIRREEQLERAKKIDIATIIFSSLLLKNRDDYLLML